MPLTSSGPDPGSLSDVELADILSIVAHDLRSPLTVVRGFADSIVEYWDSFDDARKLDLVRGIARNAAVLNLRLERALVAARLQAGVFDPDPQPLDIGDLVGRAVTEVAAGLPDRPVDTVVPAGLPEAWGDPTCQWQLVANLVSNAFRHSPPERPVQVTVAVHDTVLEVSVVDAGPGIPDGDQPVLLRPFTRFERTGPVTPGRPRMSVRGLGLGLCWRLAALEGGTIHYRHPGHGGSVFTYTVPRARPDGTGPL